VTGVCSPWQSPLPPSNVPLQLVSSPSTVVSRFLLPELSKHKHSDISDVAQRSWGLFSRLQQDSVLVSLSLGILQKAQGIMAVPALQSSALPSHSTTYITRTVTATSTVRHLRSEGKTNIETASTSQLRSLSTATSTASSDGERHRGVEDFLLATPMAGSATGLGMLFHPPKSPHTHSSQTHSDDHPVLRAPKRRHNNDQRIFGIDMGNVCLHQACGGTRHLVPVHRLCPDCPGHGAESASVAAEEPSVEREGCV
jgi:hypothetical protein